MESQATARYVRSTSWQGRCSKQGATEENCKGEPGLLSQVGEWSLRELDDSVHSAGRGSILAFCPETRITLPNPVGSRGSQGVWGLDSPGLLKWVRPGKWLLHVNCGLLPWGSCQGHSAFPSWEVARAPHESLLGNQLWVRWELLSGVTGP